MIIFSYITLVVLILTLILVNIYKIRLLNNARKRGKLPMKGKATMFDVRHLLMEGEKDLAIQLYCELFQVNITKARKDVEEPKEALKFNLQYLSY